MIRLVTASPDGPSAGAGASPTTPAPGFSAADLALYREVLDAAAPPDALARRSGLSGPEFTSALDRLMRLHLVQESVAHAGAYEAVSPDLAAAELAARTEEQARALLRHSEIVRRQLGSLAPLYHEARRRRMAVMNSETITDSVEVRKRLQEIALNAQETVLAAHPTMAAPQALAAGLALDTALLERGLNYRVVFPHTALRQQHGRDHIRALRGLGARIRTAPIIPARLLIVDGEVAVIPLPPEMGPGAALVRDVPVIEFLTGIFEHTWDRATATEDDDAPDHLFEEVELAILTELARGRTDEAIARRLGISTRTLRRYLTSLAERLGADTRFQMGMAAFAAGLVGQRADVG
jgi:DNA-binding CsgD family transcriptional regulator/sugar-specific transcriptional regulator TrmB